jgi:hypothetical protein
MWIDGTRRRARSWRGRVLQAATFIVLAAGCSAPPADQAEASAPGRAGVTQNTSDDPCRFATAEAVGKAFGRPMQSSTLVDACVYRGTPTGLVAVRVKAGPEGTILRHVKSAAAQGREGAEKAATTVGDAYFDSIIPAFIGRVGNYDVQITISGTDGEPTIQPVPRDAMIAVGTRIMETIARK